MTTFTTGFRQDSSDKDAAYPLSAIMGAGKRPVSKAWKPGPVLNQGPTQSCVGHACWQFLAGEPGVNSPFETVSPFHIWGEARKIDEFDDSVQGTSVRAGLNVLKREGHIKAYYWATSAEEAVEYILRIGPLALGIRWPDSMNYPDSKGIIKPVGRGGSGHAVFACAANLRSKYVTIQNSWGKSWGRNGLAKLHFDDLGRLLREGGVAAAVSEG